MGTIREAWRQVRSDLRAGKNLELYVLVLLSSVLIILNALGVTTPTVLASATLAVLGILGIALLQLCRQVERLESVATQFAASRSLATQFFLPEDDITEIEQMIRSSRTLWLWGAVLTAHIPPLVGLLGECMQQNGLNVRVLLLKESSASIDMASFRAQGVSADDLDTELRQNIRKLRSAAAQTANGGLEVRVIDYLAPYTLYAYDPELSSGEPDPDGKIELRLTTFRGSHYMRPTFTLTAAKDGEWYSHFCKEFKKVWDAAEQQ